MENIGNKTLASFLALSIASLPLYSFAQTNYPSVTETQQSRALIRIDELDAQMRDITNRLEKLEAQNQALVLENERLVKLIDDKRAIEIADNITTNDVPKDNSERKVEAVVKAPDIKPESPPIVPPEAKPPIAAKTAKSLIDAAKLDIQSGEYEKAELKLVEINTNFNKSSENPEATWLLGETRFVQQAWAPAAQAYISYLKNTPTGPRVSEVFLRLATSFRQLGDNKQRCLALSEYKKRTPNPTNIIQIRADTEFAAGSCP